jgi:hypothetical protein
MSEFEIITITLSFIIGLGVAQLLSSFGAAVRDRLEHPLHWMPFAWGLMILLFSIQFWFALFDLDSVLSDWSWLWYSQILALSIALFVAVTLILPTRVSSSTGDLRADFIAHGRYALLALAAYLLGWLSPNAKMNDSNFFIEPNALNVAMAIVTLIVFRSRSNRTWLASTIVFFLIFLYAVLFVYSAPGE